VAGTRTVVAGTTTVVVTDPVAGAVVSGALTGVSGSPSGEVEEAAVVAQPAAASSTNGRLTATRRRSPEPPAPKMIFATTVRHARLPIGGTPVSPSVAAVVIGPCGAALLRTESELRIQHDRVLLPSARTGNGEIRVAHDGGLVADEIARCPTFRNVVSGPVVVGLLTQPELLVRSRCVLLHPDTA